MHDIKLEDIQKVIEEYFHEKLEDINILPDIKIYHNKYIFSAEIYSPTVKVNTGIGGLKLLLKQTFVPLKIQYNGKILSLEEYDDFLKKLFKDEL